jgi:hypothetical protein
METTTPIPTPSPSTGGFRLAQLSIEEFVDLIQELDQYAFANDVMGPGEHRYHYPHFQYPMKFAVLEALRNHPQTAYTQELEWKLALINATAELHESDDWIIQTLEDALNRGILLPSEINVYLNQFGFKVGSWSSWSAADPDVSNLFGDGITQSVFVINSDSNHNHLGSADDGILVTLRGDQPGEYDLLKIFSRYNFAAGRWAIGCGPDNLDIDKDGIFEVCAVFTLVYTGYRPPTDLYLLEWQGDHFTNLAKNLPQSGYDDYNFFPEEYPGVDFLIERWSPPGFLHGYSFNGETFEMVYADPPLDLVDELVTNGNYAQAVSEMERLLSMDTADDILENEPFATGLQKLEFTAALVYALNNQPSQAKQALQNLIASIDPQEYPQMLQAVQAFNQLYYDAADLYLACQVALDILTPAYEEVYDYSWYYQDPVIDYCRSSAPILAAINLIDPTATTDLPTIMRNSGIDVQQSAAIDVLNDGNRDWVISTRLLAADDLTAYRDDQSTILAIQYNSQWFAQEVNTTYKLTPNLSASLAVLPGLSYPAVVILDGEEITIVEINVVDEEVTFATLLNQYGTSYNFVTSDSVFLNVLDFEDACHVNEYDFRVRDFRWNEQTRSFETGDPIASLLFSQEVSPAIIATLQQLYQEVSAYYQIIERLPDDCYGGTYIDERAKLLYAIGQVYEFTGDEVNAVQTYWRVWTEFPGTPYAIMARAKLEPVSP